MHKASIVALFMMAEKWQWPHYQSGNGHTRFSGTTGCHVTQPSKLYSCQVTNNIKNDNLLMLLLTTHLVDYKNGHKSFCLYPCPYNIMLQNLLSRSGINFSIPWVWTDPVTRFDQWNVSKWDATRSLVNTYALHLLLACLEVFHHHTKKPRNKLLDEERDTDPIPPVAPQGGQTIPEEASSKWQ